MKLTKTKVADTLMLPINPSLIIILGLYTTLWGLWLLAPWWDVFTTAPLYSVMSHFPENLWACFAIASGLGILRGVAVGSNQSLRTGALIGYFHWFVVMIMYFWGDWKNTGGITSMMLCVYCGVVWLNLHRNRHIGRNTGS